MSDASAEHAADGIDAERVTRWFEQNVPDVRPPLSFELIAGGRSNLSYRVVDAGGGTWALRRPPLQGVLASAHDMAREHRVISGLHGTDVPVPRPVGLCEDESVNGAPFYVMDFVEGLVPRDERTTSEAFDEPERRGVGERAVDVLVELHALDPDEVGLGELGRKQGYIERQLRRWHGQWEEGTRRRLPALDEVHEILASRIPEQVEPAIVHGDYRLDNLILSPDGEIRAVLDWELCTLGDALADVGLLLVYWTQPGDDVKALLDAPTLAPGFPSREELVARYAERSGRDLSQLDFYVAFGYWKLAIILQGVYERQAAGGYGQIDEDMARFEDLVAELAEAAREAAARLER